jgi:hypothetical protein
MKIGILPIGQVDTATTIRIKKNLERVFPDTTCLLIEDKLPLREDVYDKKRKSELTFQSTCRLNLHFERLYIVPSESVLG